MTCIASGLAAFAFVAPVAFTTMSGAAELDPLPTTTIAAPTTVTTQPVVPATAPPTALTTAPAAGGVVVLDHGPSDTIVAGASLLAQSLDQHTLGTQANPVLPRTGGSPAPFTLTGVIFLAAGVLAIRSNRRAPLR